MTDKHTSEPWYFGEIAPDDVEWGACEIWSDESDRPAATMVCGVTNARRIVACVNALSGIPTEAIESSAVDGLVSALEATKDWLADKRWGTWPYMEGAAVYSDKQEIDLKINLALAAMEVQP